MPERLRVEMASGPLWRLIGIILVCGALAALGYWLNLVNHVEDFATVATVAILYTIGFWIDKRPDRMALRLGPFSKVTQAIRDSQKDIRAWVFARPLIAGFGVAVLYGVGLVLLKSALVAGIQSLASPWLAVVVGGLLGGLIVAPEFFGALGKKIRSVGRESDDRAEHDQR